MTGWGTHLANDNAPKRISSPFPLSDMGLPLVTYQDDPEAGASRRLELEAP